MNRSPLTANKRKAGSALILALWALFFLAALAIAVGAHVAAGLRLAGSFKQDAVTYPAARAGVAHAALLAAANTNAWDGIGPAAWNGDPERFEDIALPPDVTFSVRYSIPMPEGVVTNAGMIGVESRLSLNRFNPRIFDALLYRVADYDADSARRIREAMGAYLDAKTERLLTSEAGPAYAQSSGSKRARFEVPHEWLWVEGVDAGLFERLAPYITVHGSGKVNINSASPDLLLACGDAYPAAAEVIERALAARATGEVPATGGEAGPVAFLTRRSTAFMGLAVGRSIRGNEASWIAFVVDARGKRLYWSEQ